MAAARRLLPISFGALLSFGLSILPATKSDSSQTVPRIAIIGAGIGGASAAHFAREILGAEAHIQVFERSSRVGGRLATIAINGDTYESGGSIIHPDNLYMKTFVKDLGLDELKESTGTFSVYDGDNFVFRSSSWSWVTSLKLLWRYGTSLIKMDGLVNEMLKNFSNIYTLQDKGKVFDSVPEILRAMGGPEFYKMTQMSIKKYLQEKGLSELLIDELVTAAMRMNYGQNAELSAFAGSVSLAGAQPGLWSVKGGNYKVCEGLLEKSKATLNRDVRIIEIIKKNMPGEAKPVYFLRSDKTLIDTPFDVVILAIPLDVRDNFVGCQGCRRWPSQSELGDFQLTIATFSKANLNKTTFGENPPDTILTMEKPDIPFSSIGVHYPISATKENGGGPQVRKVFSRQPLTNEVKEKLFEKADGEFMEVFWLAYPHYTPPERFDQSFVLDEGVFYVNAIEWAASAMEMSSLSGRNAALLTGRYFGKEQKSSSEEKAQHNEL